MIRERIFGIGSFAIDLTFACLPRPRSGPGPVDRDFDI